MELSSRGANLIAGYEGFVSCPYWDVNHWPIGFGTPSERGARCVSREEAQERLREMADEHFGPAVNELPGELNQNQSDALVSFVYNVGTGAIGPETGVGRALRQRQWEAAGNEMLKWNRAGGQALPGLVRRRHDERRLLLTEPPRPKPPPAGHSAAEKKLLRQLREGTAAQKRTARAKLGEQRTKLLKLARGEKDGWKKRDRGRRYQGITRALDR